MTKVEKDINVSELIKKRKYDTMVKQGYLSLLMRIIIFVIVGYLLFTQVFLLMRNTGLGMFPSLKDGDLILAYRLQNEYTKDDVVVYQVDNTLVIGRIVATEHDVVTMDESGTLLVNGTAQSGEIIYPTYAKEGIEYPYKVPEGNVFILGDYRTEADDSRDYGSISLDDLEGKVITFLRRRGI